MRSNVSGLKQQKQVMRAEVPARKGKGERGAAMVEAALCMVLIWLPLFLGTWEIGFNIIRAVQVTQICRDAGHMYSQGTDFSLPMYQNLLTSLMPSTFTPTTTGNTVVYLESLTLVDSTACGTTKNCNNLGQIVFTRAIPVGNTSLRTSNFGNPLSCMGKASGSYPPMSASNGYQIPPSIYLTDSCALANGFSGVINISSSSQFAFMSEMYVQSSSLNVANYLSTPGVYARSIF